MMKSGSAGDAAQTYCGKMFHVGRNVGYRVEELHEDFDMTSYQSLQYLLCRG